MEQGHVYEAHLLMLVTALVTQGFQQAYAQSERDLPVSIQTQCWLSLWVQQPEQGLKEAAPLTFLFLYPAGRHHGGAGSEVTGPKPHCVLHHGS